MLKVAGQDGATPQPRHGITLLAYCAVAVGVTALLAVLSGLGPGIGAIDAGYFAVGVCAAAGLALLARRAASGATAAMQGLALAADTLGAAFVLGLAGAVFAWGEDGLAFGLGLGAGLVLLQLLIASELPRWDAVSVPDFFGKRYGEAPRMIAASVVAVSMTVLLVAQITAAGLVAARLLSLGIVSGIAVSGGAVLVCFLLKGRIGMAWTAGLIFPLMLAAFLAPLVVLSAQWHGLPLPQIAYASALWQVQGLEETLLEHDLADPAYMKPLLGSFLSLNPTNVLGIILGLATGLASLPHLLSRHCTQETPHKARTTAVWALFFAVLFLTAAPVAGVYAKHALFTLIAARSEFAALPGWIFSYGKLGLVEICGVPAISADAVAAACAAIPDATSILRLQDITISPDAIALALPEMTGLGHAMLGALAAAALATALVTCDGPLTAIIRSVVVYSAAGRTPDRFASSRLSVVAVAGAIVVAVATVIAATRPAGLLTLATWAFTLAGAGLFPALVAGLWWRRANVYGASVAMILGFGLCLVYLAGTRYFAVSFFEASNSLSSAGLMARETFNELLAAWTTAVPGPERVQAWAALDEHAQSIANWWGIRPLAAALLALPVGIVAVIAVSLMTPAGTRAKVPDGGTGSGGEPADGG